MYDTDKHLCETLPAITAQVPFHIISLSFGYPPFSRCVLISRPAKSYTDIRTASVEPRAIVEKECSDFFTGRGLVTNNREQTGTQSTNHLKLQSLCRGIIQQIPSTERQRMFALSEFGHRKVYRSLGTRSPATGV